ncbi:MAG: hypothetical protein OXU20_21515 [Myxococcales bacterium]|nr:hypothetical protein [Myxococcales bacterium]MDD9965798.1 hypothetical protein [Myxococcales bacterium]
MDWMLKGVGRVGLSIVVLWGASAGLAVAQDVECDSDADCGLGRVCEVVGAGATCAAPAPCPEDEPCPEPPACEFFELRLCVPGPCDEDADCPDDERCVTETWTECVEYPSERVCTETADGVECEWIDPEPVALEDACETLTKSTCRPPWQGPCEQDNDCGPGFTCEQSLSCWCTGSGPIEGEPDFSAEGSDPEHYEHQGGDGDAEVGESGEVDPGERTTMPDLADDPQCGCEPAEHYCQLIDAPCETDDDCEVGLTCEDWAISGGSCARPPQAAHGPEPMPGPSQDLEDGESTEPASADEWVCQEQEEVVRRRCLPPSYWVPPVPIPSSAGAAPTPAGEATMDPASGHGNAAEPDDSHARPPQMSEGGEQAAGRDEDGHRGRWKRKHPRRLRPWLWCAAAQPGRSTNHIPILLSGLPALLLLRRRRPR